MNASTVLLLLLTSTGQQAGENAVADRAAKAKSRQLLELHTADAASYSIFRDVDRTQKLELSRAGLPLDQSHEERWSSG